MTEPQDGITKANVTGELERAIRLHREGQLETARSIYEQVLNVEPDNPDAHHFLGLAFYQGGEVEPAVAHIRKALQAAPAYVEACNNLGIISQALGQLEEAETCYRKVIELKPEHADSHNNLGVVLKIQGQMREAGAAFREALALDENHAQAHHNLGNLLRRAGENAEAIRHFRTAIATGLDTSEARQALVEALHSTGQLTHAQTVVDEWLENEPGNPIAQHLQAAQQGQPTPSRASDDYVKTIFDSLAGSFDEHLGDLGYQAPELVIKALNAGLNPGASGLSVLDAGCGTGLCGPMVRSLAGRLVGIDLSPRMLQRANETHAYDELIEGELTAYLQGQPDTFDIIICADTLCYFGDLSEVTDAAGTSLKPGGCFVFTVEYLEHGGKSGFRLNPHGRYSHGESYIRTVLDGAGLSLESLSVDTIRQEIGEQVKGVVVSAMRPQAL